MFNLFKKKQKSCLGIDLGSTGIKIVELSREKERVYLSNYVLAQTKIGSTFNVVRQDPNELASLLDILFEKSGIRTRQAVISLSAGDTFSTIIDLPSMSENELNQAIPYEARKYVPVPIEDVALDWSVVGEFASAEAPEQPMAVAKTTQILLVAVPQDVIKKIVQIAKKTNLEVLAVEQESFSIIRALIGNDQGGYLIIDIGESSIDLIIMDQGAIRIIHTLEKSKPEDLGLEASKIIDLYQNRYQKKITKVILTGGGITQPQWQEALIRQLGIEVGMGNPFARINCDPALASALQEISSFMSVAVGGAMREI